MIALTLYTRSYCSLCNKMLEAIQQQPELLGCTLETVDIDTNPQLLERYDELVPILCAGGIALFHHHFDAARWAAFFKKSAPAQPNSDLIPIPVQKCS